MDTTTVGIYREDMEKLKRVKLSESAAQGVQLSFADVLHQILSGILVVVADAQA